MAFIISEICRDPQPNTGFQKRHQAASLFAPEDHTCSQGLNHKDALGFVKKKKKNNTVHVFFKRFIQQQIELDSCSNESGWSGSGCGEAAVCHLKIDIMREKVLFCLHVN